jgi:hypothetical protein
MMSSALALPGAQPAQRSPRTARRLRLAVLWRRAQLDRALADGADAAGSPDLALRAAQLESARVRGGYAAALRNVLDAAEEPRRPISSAAPLNRRAIRFARPALVDFAAALTRPGHVRARGVAIAATLLRDPDSPLFVPAEPDALWDLARAGTHALD